MKQILQNIVNEYRDQIKDLFVKHLTSIQGSMNYNINSIFDDLLDTYFVDLEDLKCNINENIYQKYRQKYKAVDADVIYTCYLALSRAITDFFMQLIFTSQFIELNDPNISTQNGSLGTSGRIAKLMTSKNINDLTEFLSGRWSKEPELVIFPLKNENNKSPVTVSVTINAVCSHHLVRFGNEFGNSSSKVIISYIPEKYVLGLSKINRWVEWVARRGWLQEDLTNYIGEELKKKLQTDDIYVGLINMQHGCVSFRGKNDVLGYTTTEYVSGKYTDINFKNSVIHNN